MNDTLLEQRLRRVLTPEEELLWWGRPRQGFMLEASDAIFIPLVIVWLGVGFLMRFEEFPEVPWYPMAWKGALVLFGTFVFFGRFIGDARRRKGTIYGVTSSRVIILTKLLRESVQSLELRSLSDISLSLSGRHDESGYIVLGPKNPATFFAVPGLPGSRKYEVPALRAIPQARKVYELIRKAQSEVA